MEYFIKCFLNLPQQYVRLALRPPQKAPIVPLTIGGLFTKSGKDWFNKIIRPAAVMSIVPTYVCI